MYYKVIKNGRVIDVLNRLFYVKYQPKNRIMLNCTINEAQAILSSDYKHVWHVEGLYDIPAEGYDTVELVEIDQYEYDQLKLLCLKSVEEILDAYTMQLIKDGVL